MALRVPQHPVALALLEAFAGGIAAPSANRYGRISPTLARHVQEDLGGDVDYILDGGMCALGIESTIVYLDEESAQILRPGHIQAAQIQAVLNIPVMTKESAVIRVPGALAVHYAPQTPLYVLEINSLKNKLKQTLDSGLSAAVWSQEPLALQSSQVYWLQAPKEAEIYAQQLYDKLRYFDDLSVDVIYLEACPETREWVAIQDRLKTRSYFVALIY